MQTTDTFISKAKLVHGETYDYSSSAYTKNDEKIEIICRKHGSFWITPHYHTTQKTGCPACGKIKRKDANVYTQQDFLDKAKSIHGGKYNYSKVIYVNCRNKIEIECPTHGTFWQSPDCHIGKQQQGCPRCSPSSLKTTEQFLQAARTIHGKTYDYSKSIYTGATDKIEIICQIHGSFFQQPACHINAKHGCPKCGAVRAGKTNPRVYGEEEFLKKAKAIHGDTYDYSKTIFINTNKRVVIICRVHGEFLQLPNNHLSRGHGCKKCAIETIAKKRRFNTFKFVNRSREIHGDIYDYSRVEYFNKKSPVVIICPIHGEFLQKPSVHFDGCGCQKCMMSKGEIEVKRWLDAKHFDYKSQKMFEDCRDKRKLRFDFFIPTKNALIEFDGQQHFNAGGMVHGQHKITHSDLESIKRKDEIKNYYAKSKGMKLIRISYKEIGSIPSILDAQLNALKQT